VPGWFDGGHIGFNLHRHRQGMRAPRFGTEDATRRIRAERNHATLSPHEGDSAMPGTKRELPDVQEDATPVSREELIDL